MKKIIKWALFAVIVILAVGFLVPKKSPPMLWVEKTNIVKGGEQTTTAFVTLQRERVEVIKGEPTFIITSRNSDLTFSKVKVYGYDKEGNAVFEESYALRENGDPRRGVFTSKKVADFLNNYKGKVRLCTETKGGTLDYSVPTWASRRPIRAPSERKVKDTTSKIKEKAKEIADDIRADT